MMSLAKVTKSKKVSERYVGKGLIGCSILLISHQTPPAAHYHGIPWLTNTTSGTSCQALQADYEKSKRGTP